MLQGFLFYNYISKYEPVPLFRAVPIHEQKSFEVFLVLLCNQTEAGI